MALDSERYPVSDLPVAVPQDETAWPISEAVHWSCPPATDQPIAVLGLRFQRPEDQVVGGL